MEKHAAQNIQDAFLNTARREKQDLSFQFMDGRSLTGRIKSFDKFSLLIDAEGQDCLVFKHAISNIRIEKTSHEFRVKYLGRKTDNA